MPLGFRSLSHGTVPFGFFNVATDMILLADHFVFAFDFCAWIAEWAGAADSVSESRPFWVIEDPLKIGDLHGAMAGTDLTGLIGATYARYPFPVDPRAFKQDPEGSRTRPAVERLVGEYAGAARPVRVTIDTEALTFSAGSYAFDGPVFRELLRYLALGGLPRWREGRQPDYVKEMTATILRSESRLFAYSGGRL